VQGIIIPEGALNAKLRFEIKIISDKISFLIFPGGDGEG